jgi:hypothetical protein
MGLRSFIFAGISIGRGVVRVVVMTIIVSVFQLLFFFASADSDMI